MSIHVTLHDVSPESRYEMEAFLSDAARALVRPALLVVPHFHGVARLTDHPRFAERLRELQSQGHEIYLHGYYHRADVDRVVNGGGSPTSRGLGWLWNQKIVSNGEAEFADLSRREALERLERGIEMLNGLGLRIDGFVPPAWSMPDWLIPILATLGIGYTEDHLSVIDPAGARRKNTLLINFATRTPARMLSTLAFSRATSPVATRVPTRLAVHPGDYRVSLVRRHVQRLLQKFSGNYASTGLELFGDRAAQGARGATSSDAGFGTSRSI